MTDLEIIGIPFSNYVRSVRLLCEEKGVSYKLNAAMPHSADVKAIHPGGQVPCLKHKDVALFESQAIATYIDKAFPGPKLIPEDALGAALCTQWVSYGNVQVDRWIMREFVVPSVFFDKAKGPDTAKIGTAMPQMDKVLGVLEKALAKTGHLVGDKLTFADLNVAPMIAALERFPHGKELLARNPNVTAFLAKMKARPSWPKTEPPPRG